MYDRCNKDSKLSLKFLQKNWWDHFAWITKIFTRKNGHFWHFFAKTCLEMGQNLFESLQKLDILKELAFLVYKNIISSILGFMGQQENLRLQLSQSSASSLEPCPPQTLPFRLLLLLLLLFFWGCWFI